MSPAQKRLQWRGTKRILWHVAVAAVGMIAIWVGLYGAGMFILLVMEILIN